VGSSIVTADSRPLWSSEKVGTWAVAAGKIANERIASRIASGKEMMLLPLIYWKMGFSLLRNMFRNLHRPGGFSCISGIIPGLFPYVNMT
jgi:hypothetical protein